METARATPSLSQLEDLELPSIPAIVLRVIQLVSDPDVDLKTLCRAVEQDPALASRVLKLANSAFFRQSARVSTLDRALVLIGLNAMRSLVLGVTIMEAVDRSGPDGLDLREFWRDSLLRACIARALAERRHRTLSEEAYLIGLMQDLGIPVLLKTDPTYASMLAEAGGCRQRLHRIETDAGALSHSQVIDHLAHAWSFPEVLRAPLADHHERPAAEHAKDATTALHQIAYVVGSIPVGAVQLDALYDPNLAEFTETCFGLDRVRFEQTLQSGLDAFESLRQPFADLLPDACDAASALSLARELISVAQDATQLVSKLRILIVEPSKVQRRVIHGMLQSMGAQDIRQAETGHQAIELCEADPPDVITVALHLPDMQAASLEAKLRSHPDTREIKVLVISSAPDIQRDAFVDQDQLAAIAKPVRVPALRRGLAGLLKTNHD
ncbi:MAG: HDOD domain-containing protein [Myxococcales bacterium FL481]|nr:MAG: HDOD domain-containing protein [Myxococcales bacterium FL481]